MTSRDHGDPERVDGFEAELRALGEELHAPAPDPAETARAVRARLERAPAPRRHRWQRRWRWRWTRLRVAVAAVVAVAGVLAAATPQGRAVVARVLRVAGVEIQVTPSPSPVPTASVRLPGERAVSLAEARELAAFPVAVPRELGEPAEVRIADGARVVSLIWPGVRLDQYDGALGVVFRKELGPPWPEEVDVAGVPGWWIPRHHGLRYVPRGGGAPVEDTRLAGPTLIWQHGGAGLRLEGIAGLSRALAVARSLG